MQCKACGAENPQQNRFCGMCGATLERRAKLQANGYFSDRSGSEPVLKQEFSAPDASAAGVAPIAMTQAETRNIESRAPEAEARVEPAPIAPVAPVEVASQPVATRLPSPASVPVPVPVPVPVQVIEESSGSAPVTELREIPEIRETPKVQETPAPKERVVAARETAPVFTAGSSLLGLGGEVAPLQMSIPGAAEGEGSYLLVEEPRRTVSWRAWALLLILLALAGLGWSQWYASHYHRRPDLMKIFEKSGEENAQKAAPASTSAEQPEAKPAENNGTTASSPAPQATSGEPPSAAPESQKPATAAPSATSPAVTGGAAAAAPNANAGGQSAATPAPVPVSPSSAPAKRSETAASGETEHAPAADSKAVKPSEKQTPKKVAEAEPAPKYDQDPMLLRAQQYIHGRPQNCEMGMNYLKSAAESNPAAQIQMAALYESGVCVHLDRAQAYHWFSRAQQLDPHNMWLEKSRSQLWANMTPAERARAQ
ncbi:MAG: hypothetical protein ABI383_07895 [Acidobacteriaceae bacterium]